MEIVECKKMVLLVDDSKTQLGFFRIHLSKAGFDVITASNAQEAFMKIFEYQPDLFLSDVLMRDISGFQFCKILKKNIIFKKIPTILFTSSLDVMSNAFWAKQAHADGFISKNADVSDIIELVKKMLEEKTVPPEIKTKIKENRDKAESLWLENKMISDIEWMKLTIAKEFRHLIKYMDKTQELISGIWDMLSMILPYNLSFLVFNKLNCDNSVDMWANVNHFNISPDLLDELADEFMLETFGEKRKTEINVKTTNIKMAAPATLKTNYKNKKIIKIYEGENLVGAVGFYWAASQSPEIAPYYSEVIEFISELVRNKVYNENFNFLSYNNTNTGIYNKFQFIENLNIELARTTLNHSTVSVALMTFSNYFQIEKEFGANVVNYAIEKAVRLVTSSLRFPDKVYRYDHKSLLIILANVNHELAKIPINRVDNAISEMYNVGNGKEFAIETQTTIVDSNSNFHDASAILEVLVNSKNLSAPEKIMVINGTTN